MKAISSSPKYLTDFRQTHPLKKWVPKNSQLKHEELRHNIKPLCPTPESNFFTGLVTSLNAVAQSNLFVYLCLKKWLTIH